jgi:hypothetical protein
VEFPTATPVITFHLTPRSAEYWRRWTSQLGALVCGRTLFDFTDALVAVHLGVGLLELRKDPDPFRDVAWSGEARRDCANSRCRPLPRSKMPTKPPLVRFRRSVPVGRYLSVDTSSSTLASSPIWL